MRVKLLQILLSLISVLLLSGISVAANIYVTQNTSGSDSGADCANAHSASWFNANATGGNTYHLCGTFTGTAGGTMLTPPSGSAGNVLTVLFESGAVLQAPYWGSASNGAITLSGKQYVTIDGGSNGIIRNTDNGTGLTNQKSSQGIYIAASNHIEIKNVMIQNIYLNAGSSSSATDTGGQTTADVSLFANNNNILIHDNTLNNARSGVNVGFDGATIDTIQIYNNSISDHVWGIVMGAGATGTPAATNILIHDNTITDWTNWQYPSATYHTDGIILFTCGTCSFTPLIYNNYIHGDLGQGSPTAYIFCTYGNTSGTGATCTLFNNLLVNDSTHPFTLIWMRQGDAGNHAIYNNTVIGNSGNAGTLINVSGSGNIIENNIFGNGRLAIGSYDSFPGAVSVSDYNIFYNINSGSTNSMFADGDGAHFYSWLQWQGFGFDAHSSLINPQLNASYKITSSASSASLSALNLTSMGISALNFDKAGVARPPAGPWDMGAFQFIRPNPPTNLKTTVH